MIDRIQDDTRAAIDSARGAQGATRQLQDELRKLQKMIDELNLGTLRARIDELERLIAGHIADRKRS